MMRKVNVSPVNGDAFEVEVSGRAGGLELRKAIQRKLDARGKGNIPLEMIAMLRGDQVVADEDQIDLQDDSTVHFTITQFPHLNFDWMMFHMWENFLAADGYACPTSCDDDVIFYREPEAEHRIMVEQGVTLYVVNMAIINTTPLRQQVAKELPAAELESSQLPPCRASVLPHLAHCAERLQLVDDENILVYTAAEWKIALYQETEMKGRSRKDLLSRYPFQDVIEAFYSQMCWSSMETIDDLELVDQLEKWLEDDPTPGDQDYADRRPSLKEKLKDLIAILRTFASGENATERKIAGDIMISKSAKASELAQQLAELKGCSASDFTLLIDGKPLSDMSISLVSLANSEDTEGRLNFQVSLVRKTA